MRGKHSKKNTPKSSKDEFGSKINRLTKSKAYLDYCEEVYDYRAYLFNMMDREQLDFILKSIPITSHDVVLDLGCGSGSVLKLLAERYHCTGIGIDQLNADDFCSNGETITYINGDIDRVADYHLKPTVTLCIDSLYFSRDLPKFIGQLREMHNNRLYLYYSQYLFENSSEDKEVLHKDHTKLADVLNRNGIAYQAIDYSENERKLYDRFLAALKKYEEAFRAEGNADLYENKRKEDLLGKYLYSEGRASRFLYIVSQ